MSKSKNSKPCEPTSARRRRVARLDDVKLDTGEDPYANKRIRKIKKKKQEESINLSTWNVRGLNKKGKLENVIAEMVRLKIDIMGISETKLADSGRIDKDDATLFYTGNPSGQKSNYHGVGIMVRGELRKYVSNVIHFSNRCMMLNISAHPFNLNIIQVYAPTCDGDDHEVEEFYEGIDQLLKSVKSQDINIIIGDLNAKVGQGEEGKIVGKFGLGKRNVRGDRLVEFCSENNMVITNTWFQHPARRLYTWRSPADKPSHVVRNQIDYIMIKHRFRNSIIQVKTYPGADVKSDHNPVCAKMLLKLKKLKPPSNIMKFDLNRLKDETVKTSVSVKLNNCIKPICKKGNNPLTTYTDLVTEIRNITAEELTSKKAGKRQQWMTDDILLLMNERQTYKNINENKYNEIDVRINREIRAAREQWLTNKCKEIERLQQIHDSFNLHKRVKEFTNINNKRIQCTLVKQNGSIVVDKEEACEVWQDYVQHLFKDDRIPTEPLSELNLESPAILKSEFISALEHMKGRKALGPDGIAVEVLKLIHDYNIDDLVALFNKFYLSDNMLPEDWLLSIFTPLPKKANAKSCGDHRMISVMSHFLKVFLKIIQKRICNKIEENISDTQFGFRAGLGTRDALVAVQVLVQRCIDVKVDVHMCFIDFEKAFDNVNHAKLINILKSIGIDGNDIKFIENLYWKQKAKIKINNILTEEVQIEKGVRQGCILSPCLFNLYSEVIFRNAFDQLNLGIRINGKLIQNIRYADDTVLLATNPEDLQIMLQKLNNTLLEYGLRINTNKTKHMIVSKTPISETLTPLSLNNKIIDRVKSYKYLGCWLNENWESEKEIRTRIEIARNTFQKMRKLLTNRKINLKLRWRMVKCYIIPILMYGSESWTLKKNLINKLRAFEMWIYRRMLKIKWTDRITNIRVLEIMKKDLEVVSTIKKRKAAYFGHIYRNNKYNLLKLIIEGKIEGKRGRGRRRTSWTKNIRDWLKVKSIDRLIRMTEHRETYRHMVANLLDGDGT